MGNAGEVQDFPFLKNDLQTPLPTMGKPLDPADGPGKADAELGTEYPEDDRSTIHPYPADA